MTALRVFPFIGALIAIAAVVLTIIGVSTTYWFETGAGTHSGKKQWNHSLLEKSVINKILGLWQNCIANICAKVDGGRPAALAIAVWIFLS